MLQVPFLPCVGYVLQTFHEWMFGWMIRRMGGWPALTDILTIIILFNSTSQCVLFQTLSKVLYVISFIFGCLLLWLVFETFLSTCTYTIVFNYIALFYNNHYWTWSIDANHLCSTCISTCIIVFSPHFWVTRNKMENCAVNYFLFFCLYCERVFSLSEFNCSFRFLVLAVLEWHLMWSVVVAHVSQTLRCFPAHHDCNKFVTRAQASRHQRETFPEF